MRFQIKAIHILVISLLAVLAFVGWSMYAVSTDERYEVKCRKGASGQTICD